MQNITPRDMLAVQSDDGVFFAVCPCGKAKIGDSIETITGKRGDVLAVCPDDEKAVSKLIEHHTAVQKVAKVASWEVA